MLNQPEEQEKKQHQKDGREQLVFFEPSGYCLSNLHEYETVTRFSLSETGGCVSAEVACNGTRYVCRSLDMLNN